MLAEGRGGGPANAAIFWGGIQVGGPCLLAHTCASPIPEVVKSRAIAQEAN